MSELPKGAFHVVQKDETLSKIAEHYGVSVEEIARENNLRSPFSVTVGKRLVIPNQALDRTVEKPLEKSKNAKSPDNSEGFLSWPIVGPITQKFGEGDEAHRNGITFEGNDSAKVLAAGSGTVGHVGDIPGLGSVVLIKHADNLVSVYAHLQRSEVSSGDEVTRNQVVGTLGNSGRGVKPTLYFEVRLRAKPVNPLKFLEAKSQ